MLVIKHSSTKLAIFVCIEILQKKKKKKKDKRKKEKKKRFANISCTKISHSEF